MITSVELGNFLSHSSTKLDFEEGVTVFVGPNGAGKSSIVDACERKFPNSTDVIMSTFPF